MTRIQIDGSAMVRLRTGLRLTQEDLARRADVTVRTVARLEKGDCDPRPNTIERLADALDCTVDDLLVEVAS